MTRGHCLLGACLFAGGALAQSIVVAPELLGTWASADMDCTRVGPSTVTITEDSVQRYDAKGTIGSGRIIGRKSIEVFFDKSGQGIHPLGQRTFRLSTDGTMLLEISNDSVVETRHKCQLAAK
jgi:hypothetical protein